MLCVYIAEVFHAFNLLNITIFSIVRSNVSVTPCMIVTRRKTQTATAAIVHRHHHQLHHLTIQRMINPRDVLKLVVSIGQATRHRADSQQDFHRSHPGEVIVTRN